MRHCHGFTWSIRMGDLEIFISSLSKLTNIFFALNRSKFARWLVKYYYSNFEIKWKTSRVYNQFKQGWFAIRRTKNTFPSASIDLTLEQTTNAEEPSQRLRVLFILNPISAKQRWVESHYLFTGIVSTPL